MELLACLLVAMFLFKKENIVLLLVCLFLVAIFQIAKYFSPEYGVYAVCIIGFMIAVYAFAIQDPQKKEHRKDKEGEYEEFVKKVKSSLKP